MRDLGALPCGPTQPYNLGHMPYTAAIPIRGNLPRCKARRGYGRVAVKACAVNVAVVKRPQQSSQLSTLPKCTLLAWSVLSELIPK